MIVHGEAKRFSSDMPRDGLSSVLNDAVARIEDDSVDEKDFDRIKSACLAIDMPTDPIYQRHFRIGLDLLGWSYRGGTPQQMVASRDLVGQLHKIKAVSMMTARQIWQAGAKRVSIPNSFDAFARLSPFQRLVLQGQLVHECDLDAGYWNTVMLGRAWNETDDLEQMRVLNAGDPLCPTSTAMQTTIGQTICRRSLELGQKLGRVDSFDVALNPDPELDNQRRIGLEKAYGVDSVPKELTFTRADARDLPWDDQVFDVVVSGGMLDHVLGADKALEELTRVLRPGGRLFVSGHHLGVGFETIERFVYAIGEYNHFSFKEGKSTAVDPSTVKAWGCDLRLNPIYEMRRPHSWVLGFERL